MSLYEQYYSKTNKDYIFSMLQKIINDEHEIDISGNFVVKDYYDSQIDKVFKNNNVDNISDLNRILLDTCITYFTENFISNDSAKQNIKDDYTTIINARSNTESSSIDEQSSLLTYSPMIPEENQLIEKEQIEPIEEKQYEPFSFNSIKRTNLQSSRYNYKIKNDKENQINHLSKLFIPIENNHIFSMPLLKVKLPDFKKEILLERKEKVEHHKRIYGIYEPIEKILLPPIEVEKIRVKITDISDVEYTHNDILSVNIVEIKHNYLILTCSNIYKNDYSPGDFIKMINHRKHNLDELFVYPLKIKRIKDNIIVCETNDYCEYENKILTNIDMKLINISNQNIIYFNL
jgi:hypothetical protein